MQIHVNLIGDTSENETSEDVTEFQESNNDQVEHNTNAEHDHSDEHDHSVEHDHSDEHGPQC